MLRIATSPNRRGLGSRIQLAGYARGSPVRKDSPGRGRWRKSARRGTAGEPKARLRGLSRRSLPYRTVNALANGMKALVNICICETKNRNAQHPERIGALGVSLQRICFVMLAPVNFYSEMCRRTVNVRNVFSNGALPVKPRCVRTEKQIPQLPLLRRHILPESFCTRYQLSFVWIAAHKTPPSKTLFLPPPLLGEAS